MDKLLPFIFLLAIMVSCNSNDDDNDNDRSCPNGMSYNKNSYLDYLPYSIGDLIFLEDSLGNSDTLRVTSYSTELHREGTSCSESENFKVDVNLNYDATKICQITFTSQVFPHVLSVSSIGECIVGGNSYENFDFFSNYEFEGVTYESVYEIDLEAANAAFEKIVIAKHAGFLFFTINGITRKVI